MPRLSLIFSTMQITILLVLAMAISSALGANLLQGTRSLTAGQKDNYYLNKIGKLLRIFIFIQNVLQKRLYLIIIIFGNIVKHGWLELEKQKNKIKFSKRNLKY